MAPTAYMKRNDLLPVLKGIAKDADGVIVDLTNAASIEFHMTPMGSTTPKINTTASFGVRSAGEMLYTWAGDDTDTAGQFYAEWEVTWLGQTETFPNGEHIVVVITGDLA